MLGTTFEASTVASGYGAYLAQPILREAVEGREGAIEEAEAQRLLEKCMTVLWYRDARSTDKVCFWGRPTRGGALPCRVGSR